MNPPTSEGLIGGIVFDIQRMSIHDGPGIRTTVFLKGCPLRCVWCHNPEGLELAAQLAFTTALCAGCGHCFSGCPQSAHVLEGDEHRLIREQCVRCMTCAQACCSGALEVIGKHLSALAVLEEAEKDRVFYEESGGGMTLSGGEPLVQFSFVRALLQGARARGIHTCVQTSGAAPTPHFQNIAGLVDVFLFDYKETDPDRHKEYTGQSNLNILRNLAALDALGTATVLRCPIVPELNLRDDHLEGIARTAQSLEHGRGVELVPYHPFGQSKCERLGVDPAPSFRAPTSEEMDEALVKLRQLGVSNVSVC